jgi:hypothetical protein
MYVRYAFVGIDRFPICEFFDFRFGFFEASCKRLHDRILWVLKASARSALLNSAEFQTKTCQEGAPAEVIDSRKNPQGC